MGPTGVGKSTFINVMTGHRQDENRCFLARFVEAGSAFGPNSARPENSKMYKMAIFSYFWNIDYRNKTANGRTESLKQFLHLFFEKIDPDFYQKGQKRQKTATLF